SVKRIWDIKPPVTVTTTSRADGFYKIEKAGGYSQLITVKKKGYQTLVRDVRFHWLENRLNLTLEPEGRPISGFGFGNGLSAILVVLIIFKKTR
ncbi:MAG: hypothetical protein LUQ01_04320, partial [Methanolinea sp.]|nr:hypothetical protein [Methanolinea sp.]